MNTFVYDGTFEGLLCAFCAALETKQASPIFETESLGQSGWLLESQYVPTDSETARALYEQVRLCSGRESLRCLVYSFLSETAGIESSQYEFVRLTLTQRRSVVEWHHNPAVAEVRTWAEKVSRETHKLTGLLRFARLCDDSLYAAYEPDHNVTMLLARHFRERLADERWVIHDKRRDLAVAWDGLQLRPVVDMPSSVDPLLAEDELAYQRLWQMFTETIAIKERINPRLQRQFMPQRYWSYLPEKTAV